MKLRNESASTVSLKKVVNDCGCLTQQVTPEVIPTGESHEFTIQYSAPPESGLIQRQLRPIVEQLTDAVHGGSYLDCRLMLVRVEMGATTASIGNNSMNGLVTGSLDGNQWFLEVPVMIVVQDGILVRYSRSKEEIVTIR